MVTDRGSIEAVVPLYANVFGGENLLSRLRADLAQRGSARPDHTMTEDRIVCRGLDIANEDGSAWDWGFDRLYSTRRALAGWRRFFAAIELPRERPSIGDLAPPFDRQRPDEQMVFALRSITFARYSAENCLLEFFATELQPILETVQVRLVLDQSSALFRIGILFGMLTSAQFAALYTMLLLDVSRPHGRALSLCKYQLCNRYFLSKQPATGRVRRHYCNDEHMLESHRLNGADRMRRSRERRGLR